MLSFKTNFFTNYPQSLVSQLASHILGNKNKLFSFTNDVIRKLIDYATKMPIEDDLKIGHKYPFNACEILCSENEFIVDKIFENTKLVRESDDSDDSNLFINIERIKFSDEEHNSTKNNDLHHQNNSKIFFNMQSEEKEKRRDSYFYENEDPIKLEFNEIESKLAQQNENQSCSNNKEVYYNSNKEKNDKKVLFSQDCHDGYRSTYKHQVNYIKI